MKASVVLPGIVVASTLLFASSQAATPTAVAWITAAEAAGQISGQPSNARRQADDLLKQARTAIKNAQFDQADSLIAQAEKTGAVYDPYQDRFVDSPTLLRKLAAEERAKVGGARKPSSLFTAMWNQPGQTPAAAPQPPQDPFAQRQSQEQAVNQLTDGAKAQATSLLADARKQLARGDKYAALAAYQKAAGLRAQFGPEEDSPEKVAAAISAAGLDMSRFAAASNDPTRGFAMNNPAEMAARDQRLPGMLPAMQGPPSGVNTAPQLNPYTLPVENNPLARSAIPVGGRQATPEQLAELNLPAPSGPGATNEAPQRLPAPPFNPVGPMTAAAPAGNKAEALRLLAQARMALDKGDLNTAGQLAKQADALKVDEAAFTANETRPWQMLLEVDKAAYKRQGVQTASAIEPAPGEGPRFPVSPGVYNPATDNSRLQQASTTMRQGGNLDDSHPQRMYENGVRALEAQDRDTAIRLFQEAWKLKDQLDPETAKQLGDKLTFLRANTAAAQPMTRPDGPANPLSPLEQVSSQQDLTRQRMVREFTIEAKAAELLAQRDPRAALNKMKTFRERVMAAELDTTARKNLLTSIDRRVAELQSYIDQNKSTIENAEKNRDILAERARKTELTIEMQDKLASLVEQFNKLMDENRYAEAEVISKQAREIEPNSAITTSMVEKAKIAKQAYFNATNKEEKEAGFLGVANSMEESSRPFDDREPIVFNPRRWADLTRRRRSRLEQQNRLSPAEMEIQKSLGKPVDVKFTDRPLSEVVSLLGTMTGVNIYLDPQGLRAEGLTSDTPVTLDLSQPISLKSALTLLLEPLNLSFVIQSEVLRVTSQQTRDSNVYAKVYYVADLVIPIPNFTPTYNMGIAGALKESLASLGYGGAAGPLNRAPLTVAADTTTPGAGGAGSINPTVMAQQQMASQNGLFPVSSARGGGQSLGGGPGGMGGGVQADFDPLIELITSTIEPDSWQDVGGPGSVSGFDTNLSLVVSQRQDIHERIADLLEQLRRLQDLQVTIEVRFITVSDRFFERIGIDFDFNIDDNTGFNNKTDQIPTGAIAAPVGSPFDDDGPSFSVGIDPNGPTADLDFRFNQGSIAATPTFGGFDAGSAANFGFAILSDIEVFFLLQAAQGDDRTNVLQAPKVTLFNGQQATIIDSSFRPFVTSVVPVVGDFAAAHQPVIVVLSEGTMMSVQAVVSSDRRFVRLTLVPFFSQIGDVETFTFNGRVTTDSGTVVQDPSNPDQNVVSGATRTVEGTTVQLPTLATTTVTTTVSVPDGGTVLLGGIKRLREGRTERGLPLVSKIPYISRLFTNVGIGRDAQSLMMMVTPRIIIQEEEEEKLGIDFEQ